MADVLKVTPEELKSTASQFKTYQGNMQTAYTAMSTAVNNLGSTWTGEASQQFKTQFESLYKNRAQSEQKMADAVDELTKAAGVYEEVENSIKSAVSQLDVGTSPFA